MRSRMMARSNSASGSGCALQVSFDELAVARVALVVSCDRASGAVPGSRAPVIFFMVLGLMFGAQPDLGKRSLQAEFDQSADGFSFARLVALLARPRGDGRFCSRG